ncbi:reverse transcriptase domain-containing protein [Tanacetum coccineum]
MNTVVAHPQANGLVEKANKSLMEGIKTRLGRERAGWVDELPNVLWAHRTSIKTSNGETPFSLTYGSEAVIPAEIVGRHPRGKIQNKVGAVLEQEGPPTNFKPGEFVFRKNEAIRVEDQGKLGPKWEGPYRVAEAYQNGYYKLQTMEDKEVPRTLHANNLRKCYL